MSGVESTRDSTVRDDSLSQSGANSPLATASATDPSVRPLGVGARSSSPAKRSASERDDDDGIQDTQQPIETSTTQSSLRSPRKTYSAHVSPMPNRFKNPTNSLSDRMIEEHAKDTVAPHITSETSSSTQGDRTMTTSSPVSTSATSVEMDNDQSTLPANSPPDVPSFDKQMEIIKLIVNSNPPVDGDKGFVISNTWVNRVQSRTAQGLHESFDKKVREGDVGPVDNSTIVLNDHFYGDLRDSFNNPFIPLRPGLVMDQDLVVVPEEAWNLIMQWYGVAEDSHVVIRFARSSSEPDIAITSGVLYELYPPICTIQKLRNDESGLTAAAIREKDLPAVHLVASRSDGYQDFLRRAKIAVGIEVPTKVQVWKVLETAAADDSRSGIPTPASSRSGSPAPQKNPAKVPPKLIVDLNSFTALEEGLQREKLSFKDETANKNYNGSLQLNTIGFPAYQTLILEEQIRESNDNEFVSDKLKKNAAQHGVNLPVGSKAISKATQDSSKLNTNSANARRSPTPSGIMTRGRMNKRGKTRGCTGLVNLGNTCYMNSAIQCIRSIEELSIYFLQGKYTDEINPNNVLGHGGAIAKAYANLVQRLFSDATSFSPQEFRRLVGRANPMFSGYGQQDSQEFLSFLVDGLHEDLDRIQKKPNTENPESDDKTVHDPNAIYELGEKFRSNHRARNDSVAMDLFNGFYKNTMICPVCDKVSVTFDPYSLLTLQLPIEQTFQHLVLVAPLNRPLVQVDVDIDKNSTIRVLKDYVGKRVGIEGNRLVMAEMYSGKFYRTFGDSEVLSEAAIQPNDRLLLCELNSPPTNWPSDDPRRNKPMITSLSSSAALTSSTPEMDSEMADQMAVPLLHRVNNSRGGQNFDCFPSFILITREEAKNLDSIFRKVLQRVSTMTSRNLFEEDGNEESTAANDSTTNNPDSDMLILSDEEQSSTDDPKIQARSLESEEDLVDVSMTDQDNESNKQISDANSISRNNSKVLDPQYFVPTDLRNLFEMKYYASNNGEIVPCAWSGLNENSVLQTLQTRVDQAQESSEPSSSTEDNYDEQTPDSSSDEDELRRPNARNNMTSANLRSVSSGSSEDGEDQNQPMSIRLKDVSRRSNGLASFKKEKWRKLADDPASEYLIRLGEGIVIDWTDFGVDQLFQKGDRTFTDPEILDDPELDAKKARRAARKKNGISLEECFEESAKTEVLSEDNAWYCNRCKKHQRATKKLEIWTAPDILVVHLKRFIQSKGYNSYSRLRDKIDVLVDFPVENLDLTGKVGLPEDKPLVYDLFAVDNHYGGLGGGHYTACAQNFFDKKWYDYNDQMVSPISPESVVTRAAYLLFYRRRSDKPLGGPILEEITNNAWASADSSSLSGEDLRPDDSSSNESSNISHGVGAKVNHQQGAQLLLGSAGGHQDLESIVQSDPNEDLLPGYDEGIGMDEDPDNPLPGIEDRQRGFIGPQMPAPTWSFDQIEGTNAPPGSSTGNSPPGSDMVEAGESAHERLLEDFPEDDDPPVQIPITAHNIEEEDPEVAEIKVSSDND